jgi:cystathionine beta-lyase/cystathionine gamma-synthase
MDKLISQTQFDLQEDFDLQLRILRDKKRALTELNARFDPDYFSLINTQCSRLEQSCLDAKEAIVKIKSEDDFLPLIQKKHDIESKFHRLLSFIAAYEVAPNWQSPSFLQCRVDQAGRKKGQIKQANNDYTRDQHSEGNLYAQDFLHEYIDHLPTLFVKVFAVSSGMAALTTIINYLRGEHGITGNILIGKGSYFENKTAIKKSFENVIEGDETDMESWRDLLRLHRPKAVFFDSLGNNPSLTAPDCKRILDITNRELGRDVFIVVDNTGRSIFFQPFSRMVLGNSINLLCFESLNKYHQFGMDRVTGGIIYGVAQKDGTLYDYRDHGGTNIPDASVAALTVPNRTILHARLKRQERNAQFLSQSLSDILQSSKATKITKVTYPGLTSHPGTQNTSFAGSIVTLEWQKKYQNATTYNHFVQKLLHHAEQKNIPLVAGSSFGLSITRLYVPASRVGQGTPFFRIAVGTETTWEIQRILELFTECSR